MALDACRQGAWRIGSRHAGSWRRGPRALGGLLGTVVAGLTLALLPVPAAAPPAAAATRKLYVISDSVVLGAADAVKAAFPDYDVTVDGKGAVFTETAADMAWANRALIGDVAIVATGHNYPYFDPPRFVRSIDKMMGVMAAAGAKWVIWVTLREPTRALTPPDQWWQLDKYAWFFPAVNQHLRDAAARYPNLILADWTSISAIPGITKDIIHLNPTGAAMMAGLLRREVDGIGRQKAGSVLTVAVSGQGGVPAGAGSAVLNVTAVHPKGGGYLTVYPCGTDPPLASNLNYVAEQTVADLVLTRLGAGGAACILVSQDVHLVVDVTGWFPADAGYTSIAPFRLVDTRAPAGRLAAGATLAVDVVGRAGVPSGAAAAVLTVTVVDPSAPGYLTVHPCGEARPVASNLNYVAGQTVAALVVAKPGTGGRVCVYSDQAADVVVDLAGWFSGAGVSAITPRRVLDTRQQGVPVAGGATRTVALTAAGVPATATGAILNVTATQPSTLGYLTVHPCGGPAPLASNLNYGAGQTVANLALTGLGSGATACVFSSATTHLVVDLNGWFPSSAGHHPLVPARLVDTRANGPQR